MSTRPKALTDMQRRRRRAGDVLRTVVACPVCGPLQGVLHHRALRIVAWRRAIRFECRACGLRFSTTVEDIDKAIKANGLGQLVDIIVRSDEQA